MPERLALPLKTRQASEATPNLDAFVHANERPGSLEEAFHHARRALEATGHFDEVKDIRDQAETLRAHAKRAKWSLEVQNQCAEIKLRAERKGGAILSTFTVKGGQIRKSHDATYDRVGILDDLGISKSQSSRWQSVASIPETIFEEYLVTAHEASMEITQAAALRLARQMKKESAPPSEEYLVQQRASRFKKHINRLKRLIDDLKGAQWTGLSRDEAVRQLEDLLKLVREQ